MTRPQQPSILSFFQPRSQPQYAAPPSAAAPPKNSEDKANGTTTTTPTPPPPPPLPQTNPSIGTQRQSSPSIPATAAAALPPRIPVLPSPPSLPSQASVVPVAEHHIPALRRINSLLLSVSYPDSFYAKALDPLASGLFSRVILWQDTTDAEPKVVGGVVCRLEPNPFLDQNGRPRPTPPPGTKNQPPIPIETKPLYAIYIQSLALLSPYRSQGLAAAALEHIVASAAVLPAAGSTIDARTLYAHVWTENEEGLKWYESRGFVRHGREPIQGYYFKLRPDSAWLMRRDIGPGATQQNKLLHPQPQPPPPTSNNSTIAAAINLPPISSTSSTPSQPPPPGPPPRQLSTTSASSAASSSLSFQNARPETEWNDLPEEMVVQRSGSSANLLLSAPGSAPSSSRSSSTARKKKEKRAYPAAAFGQ